MAATWHPLFASFITDTMTKPENGNTTAFHESFIWHVFLQLAEVLAYIHHGRDQRYPKTQLPKKDWISVVYRDIKPYNVLLRRNTASDNPAHAAAYDKEPYPNIILADFGVAIRARLRGFEPSAESSTLSQAQTQS
ncbi:MAG: hypothetical protein L6R37_003960 [Teloschistes peruensis]|nr:MAG: hypothetical protein L6R37_003960 [Teloschistes peruensis]